MSLLGLENIEPIDGRYGNRALFSDEEMREVAQARERGLSWRQIQDATKRHKNADSLNGAYVYWAKKQR